MDETKFISADDLYYKGLKQPKMLIEGLLSTGLAVLSGDSKIGKSWMVLWFCLKIAKGEPIWGIPTEKKDVVYYALEDTQARIQRRLHMLTDDPPEKANRKQRYFTFSLNDAKLPLATKSVTIGTTSDTFRICQAFGILSIHFMPLSFISRIYFTAF